jgi:hypothetical protein
LKRGWIRSKGCMRDAMTNQNEVAKQQLVSLLKEKRAVLMVGAGSSKFVGYLLWDELLDELRNEFAPSLQKPNGEYDRAKFANSIKLQVENNKRKPEYYKFLERRFEPKHSGRTHDEFHRVLVDFRFRGIVTTNYDNVLESAIVEALSNDTDFYPLCDWVDLCDTNKSYRVSDFLHSLSTTSDYKSVLHLHGYYKNSENIILTENDYLRQYGNLDEEGKQTQVPLDKLHRKVIWALLAMYPVVFIGFRMTDPFFMSLLKVVRDDLKLDGDKLHFAILPNTDIERAPLLSRGYCVQPIFYPVPEKTSPEQRTDHGGLKRLIFELADKVGVPIGSSSVASITKKMLER